MIDNKYKKIYDEFIKKYEEIHPNPWHQISKNDLKEIYNNLLNKMNIVDKYRLIVTSKFHIRSR